MCVYIYIYIYIYRVKKHEEGGKHVLKRRETFRLELERETRRLTAGLIEADAPI